MIRKAIFAGFTGTAAVAMMALGAPAASQAATAVAHPDGVSPTTLYDEFGTAGVYTQSFAHSFSSVKGTFDLLPNNTDSLILPFGGATGIQLCNSSTGEVYQAGVVYNPTNNTYVFGYTAGTYTSGGINGDLCDGNTFLGFSGTVGNTGFTALGAVPQGHSIEAELKVVYSSHGTPRGILVYAEDVTEGVADYQTYLSFGGNHELGYLNEAAAGISTDLTVLAPPAVNDVVDFSDVTASSSGVTQGFANWNAVGVASSGNGLPPALLTPASFTPTSGPHKVWVKGHWTGSVKKHTHRWVKGCWKTVGGGPSSFSINEGGVIGL